jgi:hypothetical protein
LASKVLECKLTESRLILLSLISREIDKKGQVSTANDLEEELVTFQ